MPAPARSELPTDHQAPYVSPFGSRTNATKRQPDGKENGNNQQDEGPGSKVKKTQRNKDCYPGIEQEKPGWRLRRPPMIRFGLHCDDVAGRIELSVSDCAVSQLILPC